MTDIDIVDLLENVRTKTLLENAALAEIKRLRKGLEILADPESFSASINIDDAIPVKVSDFAAAILKGIR